MRHPLLAECEQIENELLDLIEIAGDEERYDEIELRWAAVQLWIVEFRRRVDILVDKTSKE